ncbi:rod-binding protein [Belnapia sp. T18]|uniref:Rod-binding protein n=1 Tax=Belnapia arida TaxID=2804533 RepID=A0ABS1TW24_9PROT|nr:rod-binding protein [Belnapia arida]MBL6076633.1 rod-binding protein [Belnapia arida]
MNPVSLQLAPPALRRAAQAFEAQALGQMLQSIFATLPKGRFGGGAAEAQWQPMLVDEMAKACSRSGHGLGLGDAVLREMLRWQAAGARTEDQSQ